jgi:predicted dehydrogenase
VLSGLAGVAEVMLVEPNPEARQAMLSAFPAARPFPSLESALARADAVVIATPPQSHAELASLALRAGKHVLVEKPLATSSPEARALVDEARRSNAILMVGHTFQFNPAVRELARRLGEGEFGNIFYIHSSRLNLGLYRSDVNVVWDLAPHDITIMNYLLRSAPSAVTAWGNALASTSVEDLAFIRLDYEDLGIAGYVHLSWLDPRKVRRVTVVGSQKMAVYDDLAEERLRIFDRGVEPASGYQPHERPVAYRYGDITSPHIGFDEPLALEDGHFVDCIRRQTAPETSGTDGLEVIAVLEAIDRSLRLGTPVAVDYDRQPVADDGHIGDQRVAV